MITKVRICALALVTSILTMSADAEISWGINGHPLRQSAYRDTTIDFQIDLLIELGVTHYRIDVKLNPDGTLPSTDMVRFNELISKAGSRGITLCPVVTLPGSGTAADPVAAWALGHDVGQQFASDYGEHLDYYGIGNEVDNFLEPTGSGELPTQYNAAKVAIVLPYLHGMATAIRNTDPSAKIVISGNWIHFGFLELVSSFTYNGTSLPFDIIDWHWYSNMGDMVNINGNRGSLFDYLEEFGKPVWIGEVNRVNGNINNASSDFSFNEDPNHDIANCQWLERFAEQACESGIVEAFFVYELFDEPYLNSGQSNYGLINWVGDGPYDFSAYELKPAFHSYKLIVERQVHGVEDLIRCIYERVLGIEPTENNLVYWGNQIEWNGIDSAVSDLLTAKDDLLFVQRAYQLILGRENPPPVSDGGVTFWTNRLSNGLSREDLLINFGGGSAFWKNAGYTKRGQIELLYRSFLRRQGTNSEVDALEELPLNSYDMTRLFVNNNNMHAITVDEEYARWVIAEMYRRIFNREIDPDYLDPLVSARLAGSSSQRTILEDFIKSEEFMNQAVKDGYALRHQGQP